MPNNNCCDKNETIKSIGISLKNIMIGISAIIASCEAPKSLKDLAASYTSMQIQLTNVQNSNSNTNVFNLQLLKEKLQKSIFDPQALEANIREISPHDLSALGLKTSKENLLENLSKAQTSSESKAVLQRYMPAVLLDSQDKPFKLNESRLAP